jgi:CRP-like cAMP-binding protein
MKPGREGIEVTLSHRQIGYLIGANRDTVTRALGELALADLLEINYRRLVILDPEALRRLAGEPVGAEDGGP